MRRIILAFALIISFQSHGQITFIDSNTSWKQLSQQAKEQDKLIFIHFENSECVQCNEVASQGFSSTELKELFDDFVSIRCNVASSNGRSLAQKFGIMSSLLSLYVDPDGNILHVNNGSTSNSYVYEKGAELALSRKGRKQLSDYDKEYKNGERGITFLKEYIIKKREASMAVDELLDEYVASLPADSLNNFQTVKAIYEFAPSLDSKAYKTVVTQTPRLLIDSIYNTAPFNDRKLLNDGIIENSIRIAVRNRDENLARTVAAFTRDSHGGDHSKGETAYAKTITRYYYQIRDRQRYFEHAVNLMESKYMPLTIDSLNAMDDAAFMAQRTFMEVKPKKPQQGIMVRSFAIAPPSQFIAKDLNEHAYHFYELTSDKDLLEKALAWSKKSMELSDDKGKRAHGPFKLGDPNLIDTYAHILYKLGRKDEAVEWQTKAVEAQKVSGMAYESFEIRLNKMKTGTL
jgi:tetratricopeptide (TPR) repeat protein